MAMARMATSVWSIGPHKSQCRKSQRPMVRQRGFQKRSTSEQKKGWMSKRRDRKAFWRLYENIKSETPLPPAVVNQNIGEGQKQHKEPYKEGSTALALLKNNPQSEAKIALVTILFLAGPDSTLHESIFMSTCLFWLWFPTVSFASKTKLGTSQSWTAWSPCQWVQWEDQRLSSWRRSCLQPLPAKVVSFLSMRNCLRTEKSYSKSHPLHIIDYSNVIRMASIPRNSPVHHLP